MSVHDFDEAWTLDQLLSLRRLEWYSTRSGHMTCSHYMREMMSILG